MQTHLITGFPGFIATQLIKELLRVGEVEKIYAVVQSSQVDLAKERAASIMNEMKLSFPFEIVVGDITKADLGMAQQLINSLHEETLIMWHLAAIYDLAVQAEIAWQVNVEGTRQVVEFVRNHPSIERFIHPNNDI